MSYSRADNVREHSYFSSATTERYRNQNGGYCSNGPSTSRFRYTNYSHSPASRPRVTLLTTSGSRSLDDRIAAFASSSQSTVLKSSIQFVRAKRPFESDSKELKSKYTCVTGKFSADRTNVNGQADGIRAYPTSTGSPKLLNGNGSLPGLIDHSAYPAIRCAGVPPPSFEIFPADSVRLQWDPSLRRSTGVGLNNLGNTCFLNSVLQVLTNTAPLANYLLLDEHDPRKCPAANGGICALCIMKIHLSHIRQCASVGHDSVSPQHVVNRVRAFMKSHTMGRQEDAHEFLRYFVDAMQTAALFPFRDQKLDLFTKETSVISRIFGGYHKNEIVCNNCHSSSVTYDPFLDLNVEIKQSQSLDAALAHFTGVEMLTSDNAYLCPKCNRRVSAKKIFTICQPPNILTIQLKRFDHFGKIDRMITYPDRLNLRPYMTESRGSPVNYKLYGVIVHVGRTTHSGHYFAFVKNPVDQWHIMDDSRVSPVSAQTATGTASAYLLFYARISTPVASIKPQAKPQQNGFIGPQRLTMAPLASEPDEPAHPAQQQLGFKSTFSEIGATPAASFRKSQTPMSNGPLTRISITPICKPTPVQATVIRAPLRFRLNLAPTTTPLIRPKSFVAAPPVITKVTKPIQDSSISSSTKLVPYDDDDEEEEQGK